MSDGPDLQAQVDALHTVGDWLAQVTVPPVATVEVRPDGDVWLHVESSPGQPEPPDVLRLLATAVPSSHLTVDDDVVRLGGERWGRRMRLRVPLPGVPLTLWCYARAAVPRAPGRVSR